MLFFSVLFIFLLVLFLLQIGKNNEKLPPGPKRLPIIGNLHQIPSTNLHLYLCRLGKTHGPVTFLQLGNVPAVVVQSSEAARTVLKTLDHNFCNRPPLTGQQKLSYGGLDLAFTPYSEYYREVRKLCVVNLFSSKRAQSYAPIRKDEVLTMVKKITNLSSKCKVVNLSELIVTVTSSIICRVAFGRRYEDEGAERSKFHAMLSEGEAMLVAPFIKDYLPFMGWIDRLNGKYSRLERVFLELDKFYDEIINQHLGKIDKVENDNKEDIIDVLLRLKNDGCLGFELTLDHIKGLLMDIFMAGTDTSAITVIWSMAELVKQPTIMTKLQTEIRITVKDKTFVDEEDLPKLDYLKAVIKETLRLHPAVPLLIVRESIKKCTLGQYTIPQKTQVFINVWSIGRDSEKWEDPETFIPERFLEKSVDYGGNNFELIPFGAGRRMCPGMLLGIANVELILANLLHCFDWELPCGMGRYDIDEDMIPGIAMHKKTPLLLMAKKFSPI